MAQTAAHARSHSSRLCPAARFRLARCWAGRALPRAAEAAGALLTAAGSGATAAAAPPAPHSGGLEILRRLDFPRDLQTGIDAARDSLGRVLVDAGLAPVAAPFAARPWRCEIAAFWLCVAAAALLAPRRSRWTRLVVAAGLAAALASLGGGLDRYEPSRTLTSFEVVIEPQRPATSELWLGAHYDSKTEWFDHAGRALALSAALGIALGAWALAWRNPRRSTAARALAASALFFAAATLASGRFATARSHGIVDDAASVALLVETAERARAAPPERVRLRFLFWCGEEIGAQGSAAFAAAHPAPALPRSAVNLECIGAGPQIGWAAHDWAGCSAPKPDATLQMELQAAAGLPLRALAAPFVSDAGSLRRAHIPSLTLVGLDPGGRIPRGLHRPADRLDRLDLSSLEATRLLLERWIADRDRNASRD